MRGSVISEISVSRANEIPHTIASWSITGATSSPAERFSSRSPSQTDAQVCSWTTSASLRNAFRTARLRAPVRDRCGRDPPRAFARDPDAASRTMRTFSGRWRRHQRAFRECVSLETYRSICCAETEWRSGALAEAVFGSTRSDDEERSRAARRLHPFQPGQAWPRAGACAIGRTRRFVGYVRRRRCCRTSGPGDAGGEGGGDFGERHSPRLAQRHAVQQLRDPDVACAHPGHDSVRFLGL